MNKTEKKFEYQHDDKKYIYGKSERWPGEKLLVKHINELHEKQPDFRMKLLGTSGVFGEKFPIYLTKCHFKLVDEDAVAKCVVALKQSDELIRRRIGALWAWEMAWVKGTEILFFVNWYDTAYFFKNHDIFLGKDHSRFALDFGLDVMQMTFEHYRILDNGDKEKLDFEHLTKEEGNIFKNIEHIEFIREFNYPKYSLHIYNDVNVEKGILNFSNAVNADLIGMCTHGRTGFAHFFNGSISEDLVNHAKRPVITFKI